MTRLNKRDVETLLSTYDAGPVAALTAALRRVLDRPDASWDDLLDAAPLTAPRRASLRAGDQRSLDDLARTLNEQRDLAGPPRSPPEAGAPAIRPPDRRRVAIDPPRTA